MQDCQKLRVGQVGVGHFGGARRRLMRQSGLFELAAAYDWNPKALLACQEQDGAEPMDSFEALLDFPDLEAIVVSTGAKYHAEQVVAAAERGLHVFVEKPLCASSEEIDQLLEVQKKSGVVIGVGHNDHTSAASSLAIKRAIDSGELGQLVGFEASTAHSGGLNIKEGDWRGDPERNPGGMLFQCGVHKLHELLFYFGPIHSVVCRMRYDVHTSATADSALCILEFESGLIGALNAYHVTPYRSTLAIFGTKRSLLREDRFFDEGTTLYRQDVPPARDGSKEPRVLIEIDAESDPCGNLRSFVKAIREGGQPYPSLIDGARAVGPIFAADLSARQGGAPVIVPAIG